VYGSLDFFSNFYTKLEQPTLDACHASEISAFSGLFWFWTKANGLEIFPIDNALYSIAFGTHTETAEPIDIPFGMISGLGWMIQVNRQTDKQTNKQTNNDYYISSFAEVNID